MDQVKIGMDEPQEDEYAIYRITNYSPLENLVFPKSSTYFLSNEKHFVPAPEGLEKWKNAVGAFYKKLYFRYGKRIVSKNPFNSFRIKLLYEMFPDARFIHIVRDPNCVVPSTIHMWNILTKQNALNTSGASPEFSDVVGFLKKMLDRIETDRKELPPGTMVQIRFEDLETAPVDVLKGAYEKLGLPFSTLLEARINEFIIQNKSFTKNTFSLTTEQKSVISRVLEFQNKTLGYSQDH